ncbi:MAG: gamma-glutamyltransferase family protein [Bryobacteraceae bacterium]
MKINRRVPAILLFAMLPLAAQTRPTMFPPVRGTHAMVGAGNSLEVAAGTRILNQGGNAVDAGVATVLAAAVTELDHFGLGGEMPLLIKLAGKPVAVVSGVGTAPAKATPEFFKSRKPQPWEDETRMPPIPGQGILAATVPGVFDGLILALDRFGSLSFEQVAAPALAYATDGFPLPEIFSKYIRDNEPILQLWPASSAFFMPGGNVPNRGDLFQEPALAKTLRELIAVERKTRGKRSRKLQAVRDDFYKGPLAHRIADFSERNGGLIAYSDLANFHADLDTPRTTTYRGYEVAKPGFWTQGPVMLEALNMLEGYDLRSMGHNTPEYLHTLIEVVKLAFADRDRYYGDPKFSKIPEQTLLSKEYATERRKLIDPAQASMESRPGSFGGSIAMPSGGGTSSANDTTCVNVVDSRGNVFSATPSGAWLPSVIAGDTGIPFTTRLQTLLITPGHPNQIEAGKRPRVTLSPTIVLKDGKPFLAMSTPGGDNQDQAMLQVLLNIIEFGMSPQEAVESPRFQTEHFYSSFANHEFVPGRLNVENRIPKASIDQLAAWGHKVNVTGEWSNASAPTVIEIGQGVLQGGADPRRGRFIFGW